MRETYKAILKQVFTFAVMMMACVNTIHSQIDAQYTQYWAVPGYYNPAAIGRTDFIDIHAAGRLQWVGIDNAPQSFTGLADMPFKFLEKRFGTGLVIHQESAGLFNTLNVGAQIAFIKKKFLKGDLSIGLQIGMFNETFRGTDVILPGDDEYHEGTDDAIPTTDITGTAFDVNIGAFYTHKWFWTGVSVMHATNPKISLSEESATEQYYEFAADRTFYFMGGSNIPIKNTLIELQPSFLIKTDTKFFTGEITARARYRKFLNGGLAYRWKDALSIMVGAEFKNFTVGYSYDYPLSNISKASSGSHEFFLGYKVKLDLREKNKNKHKSIRIM
ncbi:MAG: PorP/SprF family type IX secretion system membrane protein [Muribaculaceae bacterium]|nr:PorP/SprF family type IX secretion system membrane protein [Muribaculaceae bacterium]